MRNPLQALLELPEPEKIERGLRHTPQEIGQQPQTWKTTYRRCQDMRSELTTVVERWRSSSRSPVVYLLGAGTSDYVGRSIVSLLRQRWGADVWAVASTTMLTDFDDLHQRGREYLWISFSRSGDSPEGVALLQRAFEHSPQIRHLVITCNAQGAMAKLCAAHPDRAVALVLDDAVNDRGLAMTSSFTNMVIAGQCIANLQSLDEYGNALAQMVDAGTQFLPAAAEASSAIAALDCKRACFVGSGALHGAAQESSLKLVELTSGQVMTMAESPLGLRHGPLSSVDGESLFVAFLSSEARRRGYELDLLREIAKKQLGRIRAVVSAGPLDDVTELADFCLPLNCAADFPDPLRPVLDVLFGQLLGLFASLRCGLRPDQPSPSGAITRVVSPIKLYS